MRTDSHQHEVVGAGLSWMPELGVGYYPVTGSPYDRAYFDKYVGYKGTDQGLALTEARVGMVRRHWDGPVCDVGIGCGSFVEAHGHATGFDINPAGVDWLEAHHLFMNPWQGQLDALTFWDSLEHIQDPRALLANVARWVFVSLPIFTDYRHVLRSRHYRKDEHYWYFTRAGFLRWMEAQGWRAVEINSIETDLGRDGIESYAFKRHAAAPT